MGSLTSCIKRAGKALSDADRRALLSRYDAFVKDGMPASDAAEMAVTEVHGEIMDQVREAADLARAKGVEVTITGGDLTQPEAAPAAPEPPSAAEPAPAAATAPEPAPQAAPEAPVRPAMPPRMADAITSEEAARQVAAAAWGRAAVRLERAGLLRYITRDRLPAMLGISPAEAAEIKGVYVDGVAYVVYDNTTAKELPGVLLHEAGIHAIVRNEVDQATWDAIVARTRRAVGRDPDVTRAAEAVPADTAVANRDEEVLAYLVEQTPGHGLSRRIADAMLSGLNKMGFSTQRIESDAALLRRVTREMLRFKARQLSSARITSEGVSALRDRANGRQTDRERLESKIDGFSAKMSMRATPEERSAPYEPEPTWREEMEMGKRLSTTFKRWQEGRIGEDALALAVKNELERRADARQEARSRKRARGADWLREKLIGARRTGVLSPEQVEVALWMIDKNPSIADDLGIGIRAASRAGGVRGTYDIARRIVTIFAEKADGDTAAHEILHHTERMMPDDIRQGLRAEWLKKLRAEVKRVDAGNDANAKVFAKWILEAAEKGDDSLALNVWKVANKTSPPFGYDLAAVSEYWAVNGARIIRDQYESVGWVQKAKQWLREFVEKVKSAFGLRSDAAVIRGLESVMNGDGRFVTKAMLSDLTDIVSDETTGASPERQPLFSRYTPEQVAARERMGVPVDERPTLRRIVDGFRDLIGRARAIYATSGDQIIQSVFDGLHGLRMAEQRVERRLGRMLSIDDSAYVAMRLAKGLPSIMEGVLLHGSPEWNAGIVQKKAGSKGLLDALDPVAGDIDDWLAYMVARRAEKLKADGRENNLSQDDIDYGLSLAKDPATKARFDKAAADYAAIKKDILDFAEQAGVIEPGGFDADGNPTGRFAWDHIEYLPFFRVADSADVMGGARRAPRQGKPGAANQRDPTRKRLTGGKDALKDPLANIIQNFTLLIDTSLKNAAMRQAVQTLGVGAKDKAGNVTTEGEFYPVGMDWRPAVIPMSTIVRDLVKMGVSKQALQAMPPDALKGMRKMMSMRPPEGPNIVSVLENGKPKYYEVPDQFLLDSLLAFGTPREYGKFVKFLGAFSKALTVSVTRHPLFMLRNYMRDVQSAYIQSDIKPLEIGESMRFLRDSISGVAKSYTQTGLGEFLMFSGASFQAGYVSGTDPDAAAAAARRSLRRRARQNPNFLPGDSVREKALAGIRKLPWLGRGLHPMLQPMFFPVESVKQLWDQWDAIGSAIENGTREAMAEHLYRTTGNLREMAYESRDVIDFSMHGNSAFIGNMAAILPFFNARLQGLYKLYRSRQIDAGYLKSAFMQKLFGFMLMSFGNAIANVTLFADAYDDIPESEKDTYIHIGPGQPWGFRIPKAFELGIIANTVPERFVRAIQYQLTDGQMGDTPRNTGWAIASALWNTLGLNPVPPVLLAPAEIAFNYNLFQRRNIEDMGDQREPNPANRVEWYTSPTAQYLAMAIPRGVNEVAQISPKDVEHLVNSLFGMLGGEALVVGDTLIRQLDPDHPQRAESVSDWLDKFRSIRDVPLLGAFARGDAPLSATKFNDEFYHLADTVFAADTAIKAYREAVASGDRALAEKRARDVAYEMARSGGMLGQASYGEERTPDGKFTPGAIAARRSDAGVSFEGAREMRKKIDRLSELRREMAEVAETRGMDWKVKLDRIEALRQERNAIMEQTVREMRRRQRQWEASQR